MLPLEIPRARTIVVISACSAAAFGLGFASGRPGPRDLTLVGPTVDVVPCSPASPVTVRTANAEVGEELARLRRALEDSELACRLRIASAGGIEPLPWPTELPEPLGRSAMLAMLERGLEACPDVGGGDVTVDCDEYPCALYFTGSAEPYRSCGGLRAVPGTSTAMAMAGTDDGGTITGVWYVPEGDTDTPPELLSQRRLIRFQQAQELSVPTDVGP
ncbi:MAG: hypothetical protein H6738_24240 [Alphaproteobacteria bacterium]|nr:hypothetical protein [Alphaproteobacteria bacterium]